MTGAPSVLASRIIGRRGRASANGNRSASLSQIVLVPPDLPRKRLIYYRRPRIGLLRRTEIDDRTEPSASETGTPEEQDARRDLTNQHSIALAVLDLLAKMLTSSHILQIKQANSDEGIGRIAPSAPNPSQIEAQVVRHGSTSLPLIGHARLELHRKTLISSRKLLTNQTNVAQTAGQSVPSVQDHLQNEVLVVRQGSIGLTQRDLLASSVRTVHDSTSLNQTALQEGSTPTDRERSDLLRRRSTSSQAGELPMSTLQGNRRFEYI